MCMIRQTPYLDKPIYYHSYIHFNSTLDPWTNLPLPPQPPPWIIGQHSHSHQETASTPLPWNIGQLPLLALSNFLPWMRNILVLAELLLLCSRVYKAPCFDHYPPINHISNPISYTIQSHLISSHLILHPPLLITDTILAYFALIY